MASVADSVDTKLPFEQEHLHALCRMGVLDNYYRWSLGLLGSSIGRRVLDAGCGIGNGTQVLLRHAEYVAALDLSSANLNELRRRIGQTAAVETIHMDLTADISHLRDRELDTVLCLDVLEHVEDDAGLLRNFSSVIQPAGCLLLKVPAMPALFGAIDEASGHYRRYSRRALMHVVETSGWKVMDCRYMNVFGVVPYFIKSRLLRRSTNFSRTFCPWQLRLLQRVIPILQRVDGLIGPPVGQSLLLVAKKC